MNSTTKKTIILILGLFLLFVSFKVATPVYAQYGFWRLQNVAGLEQASVGEIIIRVIQWIMGIIGLVCVAFIIYGGVIYATSGGNEEHITRGKKILLWAIVGLIICILAFTIAAAVVGMIGGEGGEAGPGTDKWCAARGGSLSNLRKEFTSESACKRWAERVGYTCIHSGCEWSDNWPPCDTGCTICDTDLTNCITPSPGQCCENISDCMSSVSSRACKGPRD